MTVSVLTVFGAALVCALALTPAAAAFGRALGFMDAPQGRKIHSTPIPRSGGLALILSFLAALGAAWLTEDPQIRKLLGDRQTWAVLGGGLFIFCVGFVDDRRPLPAKVKLLAQIAAASLCFFYGVRIGSFSLGKFLFVDFAVFSYVLTVLWFVLFINAINIIDGLDGLAAGVVFFVCAVQAVLATMRQDAATAMVFAGLGGCCLGFLRYNFNPASVFLGDGGSYFLGYTVAAFSVLSSVKSQVGATILMPILAFGVPLLDTVTSPLRRFLLGKNIFEPDRQHVHHNLLAKGWSQRKAVVFLYGVTAFLAAMALVIVNMRDAPSGLIVLVLGGGLILFVRKAGYFSYFAMDKIFGWIRDISDVAGMSHDRRTFLNLQIEIAQSRSLEELWTATRLALERLRFDLAELEITQDTAHACRLDASPRPESPTREESDGLVFEWSRKGLESDKRDYLCRKSLLKLELPLMSKEGRSLGSLWLVKDLTDDPQTDFTLRRVEHLRRSVISTLETLLARP